LARPLVHRTTNAEVRSLRVDEQRSDVAVGSVVDRSDEVAVVFRAHEVKRRACQHNPAKAAVQLKSNSVHGRPSYPGGLMSNMPVTTVEISSVDRTLWLLSALCGLRLLCLD